MKHKLPLQFLLLFVPFIILWWLFSRIDFMGDLKIDEFSRDNERRLGELMFEAFVKNEERIEDEPINEHVIVFKDMICEAAGMNPKEVKVYIVNNSTINAFAIPDQQMVIYSRLITYAETPEELFGVMAHEIGHMYHRHVVKKLIKEIGITMLFAVITGDAGGKILKDIAKKISSTAFDRELETEADLFAIEMMHKAGVDPIHFANFMNRLADEKESLPEIFEVVSTHPDSRKRAANVILKRDTSNYSIKDLGIEDWEALKEFRIQARLEY
jgi:predicted Zn-dependent protease